MGVAGDTSYVKSILRAADVLDVLARSGGPLSLGEISERLGWAKSTTHGIVSTLVAASLVMQRQSDGRYGLGVHMFELGCAASDSWSALLNSQKHLQHLAVETEESAFLATVDGLDTILLDSAMVTGNYQIISPAGTRTPIYCSSHGKVLLAFQQDRERESIIRRLEFTKYTPNTIDSAERLRSDCQEIRNRGYCVEDGEYRMGLLSVSAPVFDVNGVVRYAVGIVGLFRDSRSPKVRRAVGSVLSAADAMSRALQGGAVSRQR